MIQVTFLRQLLSAFSVSYRVEYESKKKFACRITITYMIVHSNFDRDLALVA